jgi:hypothetical protein
MMNPNVGTLATRIDLGQSVHKSFAKSRCNLKPKAGTLRLEAKELNLIFSKIWRNK